MGIVIRAVFLFGLIGVVAPVTFFLVLGLVMRAVGFPLADDAAILRSRSPLLKNIVRRWLRLSQ